MNIIKKLKVNVGTTLLLLCFTITPFTSFALVHKTERFLSGTMLYVTNSSAYTSAASNFWYYSYAAGTNVLAGATNNAALTWPSPVNTVPIFPDINGDVNPNLAIQFIAGITNSGPVNQFLFYPPNFTPSMVSTIWTNPAPVAFTISTNVVTVVVAPKDSNEFYISPTPSALWAYSKTFTFAFTNINGRPLVGQTNLPTGFLQGASGLQIVSIGVTNAGDGGIGAVINGINLVGWSP